MPFIDRPSFIRLLEQLDDEDDDVALAAAREVARRMRDGGVSWDQLLVPEGGAEPEPDEPDEPEEPDDADEPEDEADEPEERDDADEPEDEEDEEEPEEPDEADEPEDEEDEEELPEETPAEDEKPPAKTRSVAALIDRMLRDDALSDETREELEELKADLAAGDFTAADERYVQALHKRLSAKR